jgi:branched-chain amino acid transport system permease protein
VSTQGNFIKYDVDIMPQVNAVLFKSIPAAVGLLLVSVVVAAAIGALFGWLFSYPAIRLKTDYLAMTLLAMAQFFQIFLNNYTPVIGGSLGLELPDPYFWAGDSRYFVATGVMVIFAVLVFIYCQKIAHAPLARTLRAMRDNDSASEALGKDDVKLRRNTLMVASAIAAVGGLLYSFYTVDVLPATFGRVVWTFWPWVIVIMGGAANNLGVGIGVVVFWFMIKFIDTTKFVFSGIIPFDVTWLEYLLIGTILIVILMLRPQGLLPERPTPTLSKSRLQSLLKKYTDQTETASGEKK